MGLISNELKESEKYMLKDEKIDNHFNSYSIVKLTLDNVAKVEAMINTDSNYKNAEDDTLGMICSKNGKIKYVGSSSYWLRQLKEVIECKKIKSSQGYVYSEIIKNLIIAIDNENSTHLNSDGCGRVAVTNRILKVKNKLKEYLGKPNYKLIDIIGSPTEIGEKNHFSFATKFCHYSCLYLFKGKKEEDNFSVYDSVVRDALPKYIKRYLNEDVKVSEYENNYYEFIKYIDKIRQKAKQEYGKKISRRGFDHLIWYYHKGMRQK